MSDDKVLCELCGAPMPKGEEMFNYHGYSGTCPRPALKPKPNLRAWLEAKRALGEYDGVLGYPLDFEIVLHLMQEWSVGLQVMLGNAERKMYEMMVERDAAISSRWITVESQPRADGTYLVAYKLADEFGYALGYFYKDVGWSRTRVWPDPQAAITHWTPIPEFPSQSTN